MTDSRSRKASTQFPQCHLMLLVKVSFKIYCWFRSEKRTKDGNLASCSISRMSLALSYCHIVGQVQVLLFSMDNTETNVTNVTRVPDFKQSDLIY